MPEIRTPFHVFFSPGGPNAHYVDKLYNYIIINMITLRLERW